MNKIEYVEVRLNDGDGNDYINFYVDGVTHSYLLEDVFEQMQSASQIMPCGHLVHYQVQEKDTQYCLLCRVNEQHAAIVYLEKTIKNAYVLLDDDHIEAAQTVLQFQMEKVKA
jgi:hypothetical protein